MSKRHPAEAEGHKEPVEGSISPIVLKSILAAIQNRWTIRILYAGVDDVKKVAAGIYTLQPYAYGLNRYSKNRILRAYIVGGGGLADIPTFRLDRIKSIVVLKNKTFNHAQGGWTGVDNLMSEMLAVVSFENAT